MNKEYLQLGKNAITSQKETAMSDLAMANVEALAYSVEDGNGNVMYECNPVSGTCSYELGMAIPGKKK